MANLSHSANVSHLGDVCAQEPIRVPGAIQPHGSLVCLAQNDLRVLHLSANADAILNMPMRIGMELAVEPAVAADILAGSATGQTTWRRVLRLAGGRFQVSSHRSRPGLRSAAAVHGPD